MVSSIFCQREMGVLTARLRVTSQEPIARTIITTQVYTIVALILTNPHSQNMLASGVISINLISSSSRHRDHLEHQDGPHNQKTYQTNDHP